MFDCLVVVVSCGTFRALTKVGHPRPPLAQVHASTSIAVLYLYAAAPLLLRRLLAALRALRG